MINTQASIMVTFVFMLDLYGFQGPHQYHRTLYKLLSDCLRLGKMQWIGLGVQR